VLDKLVVAPPAGLSPSAGLMDRQKGLIGDDRLSLSVTMGTKLIVAVKQQFARYIDRALHDADQAHAFRFNTARQGKKTAQLLAHSVFFYQKMIEMNIQMYAYESHELPLLLFSEAQLDRIITAYNSGGNEAVSALWEEKSFSGEINTYLQTQTTGIGRLGLHIDRIFGMIESAQWTDVHVDVYGSGVIQTGEALDLLHKRGIINKFPNSKNKRRVFN